MTVDVTRPTPGDDLSAPEFDLYRLIMDYRAEHGLPAIPLSSALTATAGRHAQDTLYNIWAAGLTLPEGANLHSWSDAFYYADHRDPAVMWYAPARIGVSYPGEGFEISAAGFQDGAAALAGWKASPGHNEVILDMGVWAPLEWRAVGVGVETDPAAGGPYGGLIYHVWFGAEADPAGPPRAVGGAQADAMSGTAFDDALYGLGDADTLEGGAGADLLDGGDGEDWVSYAASAQGVQVDIGFSNGVGGDAAGDRFVDVEHVWGSAHDDGVWGDDSANTIRTRGGRDYVDARGGDDAVDGGAGADTLRGGAGADGLWGGDGDDVINGDGDGDWLFGGAGADALGGDGGNDALDGGPGNDWLWGGAGSDAFVIRAASLQAGDVDRVMDMQDGHWNGADWLRFDGVRYDQIVWYEKGTSAVVQVVLDGGGSAYVEIANFTLGQLDDQYYFV